MPILDHHQRAIDRLVDAYHNDPDYEALIIGGSVAKDFARPDSDVDFLIVAKQAIFRQRLANGDLFINRRDLCDYEGGYVDGKIIDLNYLQQLVDKGNEPSRAAFEGAFAAFSHLDGLDEVLARIPVYPEEGHDQRVRAFYSMAFIQHWLIHEAERHGNQYTVLRAASQLALFAGRLILAHNRRLFPYHKWLPKTLEAVPDKPPGFVASFQALVNEPNGKRANELFDGVRSYRDWGVSDLEAYTWFMTDIEWGWMSGNAPMEDW
ncbi:MAG: nucleotidyltransferase domain-containing protein [Planctomycetota bacterium]